MAQDTNQNRPADVAQADSVGGMAKRLLNPAHLSDLARRSAATLKEQGAEQLWRDVTFRVGLAFHHDSWQHRADLPLRRELKAQRAEYADGKPGPVVSVVVPLYNTPEKFFGQMLASVQKQTYPYWQLVLVDASDAAHAAFSTHASKAAAKDPRILYKKVENGGIAANTTAGFALATGTYIALLDHDDVNEISTYHINSYMFHEAFEPYAKAGDEVLYCCFSTGIAGTYNAANLAKEELLEEYPDFKIMIKDCKNASMGFGMIVYKLLKMQENGAPKELILEAADYYIQHCRVVFTVQTLHYLIKGGRVSKMAGMVGEALDLKPILIVNEAGALEAKEKVRGRKKSLKTLVDYMENWVAEPENATVSLVHGEDAETLELLKRMVEDRLHPKEIITSCVGCAIGAHTGRGIMGAICFDANDGKYAKYQ